MVIICSCSAVFTMAMCLSLLQKFRVVVILKMPWLSGCRHYLSKASLSHFLACRAIKKCSKKCVLIRHQQSFSSILLRTFSLNCQTCETHDLISKRTAYVDFITLCPVSLPTENFYFRKVLGPTSFLFVFLLKFHLVFSHEFVSLKIPSIQAGKLVS